MELYNDTGSDKTFNQTKFVVEKEEGVNVNPFVFEEVRGAARPGDVRIAPTGAERRPREAGGSLMTTKNLSIEKILRFLCFRAI